MIEFLKARLKNRKNEKHLRMLERSLAFDVARAELETLVQSKKRSREHRRLQKEIHERKGQQQYLV